jgi:antitoxin ParD1/3/4
MVTRNVVLTEAPRTDRSPPDATRTPRRALRAGLGPGEREEAELDELRARLNCGPAQAPRGALADGNGEDAIRRAIAAARSRS